VSMFYWKHQEKRASPYKYMRRFRQVCKLYRRIWAQYVQYYCSLFVPVTLHQYFLFKYSPLPLSLPYHNNCPLSFSFIVTKIIAAHRCRARFSCSYPYASSFSSLNHRASAQPPRRTRAPSATATARTSMSLPPKTTSSAPSSPTTPFTGEGPTRMI